MVYRRVQVVVGGGWWCGNDGWVSWVGVVGGYHEWVSWVVVVVVVEEEGGCCLLTCLLMLDLGSGHGTQNILSQGIYHV